jgi:hypothetical protein
MATLRILLAAHDRYTASPNPLLQTSDAGPKIFTGRNSSVKHMSLCVIERPVVRATSELIA